MKQSFKSIMAFISLMFIYILLAGLGIYNGLGIMLFPILSIPLAIGLIKNKSVLGVDLLFNITIMIGIYLLTNSFESIIVYVVSVSVPAYAIAFFYKRNVPLPNTIMYVSIIMGIAVFSYLAVMKYLGLDYEMKFISLVDEIKAFYFNAIEVAMHSAIKQDASQEGILKEIITVNMEIIKSIYPALILSLGVVLTSIQVTLLNSMLRSKDIKKHVLRQLFNFRLSKITVLLLLIAMLIAGYGNTMNSTAVIVSMNMLFFLRILMLIVGIISFIVMLKRATISRALKVLGYILLFMLLIIPDMLVIFGCMDTIFNIRKAEIIV